MFLNEPNFEECNACGGDGCKHCDRDGLRLVDAEETDEFWMEEEE